MNIDRRLEEMRDRLEHSRPARMIVTLSNGEVVITHPVGAITMFREREIGGIASVKTDSGDYAELAGLLNALCR